jgi:beta-glucanase (GH16 family)
MVKERISHPNKTMFFDRWTTAFGRVHRIDGPAILWHDNVPEWYIQGKKYTFEQWLEANNHISAEEKVMIKLKYG